MNVNAIEHFFRQFIFYNKFDIVEALYWLSKDDKLSDEKKSLSQMSFTKKIEEKS